jgi:hypothetical protein
MSRTVSAKGNLSEAKKINESPFKTKIDRYPDVVDFIRSAVADGKAEVQIYKTLLERYPTYDLGSRPTIYNWIRKYGRITKTVEVTLYTPKYFEHMQEFDAYKEMLWSLKELKERYESAKKAEANMPIKQRGITEMLVQLIRMEKEVAELEIRLGLRAGESNVPKVNFNQQNNTFQVDGRGAEPEKDEVAELAGRVDASIARFLKGQGILDELRQVEPDGSSTS